MLPKECFPPGGWTCRTHLGYGDGRGLLAVHAGTTVNRESIILASGGTNLGGTIVEGQSALEGRVICMGAARANFIVGDEFQDVRGAQLGNSSVEVEGKVVRLESFDSAEGARASGWLNRSSGGMMSRFGILNWEVSSELV